MPAGVETFRTDGQVQTTITTYFGVFFGSFSTGGNVSGSIQDNRLIGQAPLFFINDFDGVYGGPTITLNSSNGVLSWVYEVNSENGYPISTTAADRTHTVYYGGY